MFDISSKYMNNADKFLHQLKYGILRPSKNEIRELKFKPYFNTWNNKNNFAKSFNTFFEFYRAARKTTWCWLCDKKNVTPPTLEQMQEIRDKYLKLQEFIEQKKKYYF